MERNKTVNDLLKTELDNVYPQAEHALMARQSVYYALGADPKQPELDPVKYPVHGFFLDVASGVFLAYVLTPGRFIRFSVANGEETTITVPLTQVVRVVERVVQPTIEVTIEFEAGITTSIFETRQEPHPDQENHPGVLLSRAEGRELRAGYVISATFPTAGAQHLRDMSRTLRNIIGQ